MRGINLPPLPQPPSEVEECWKLYASRLEQGWMQFPEASQLLAAYMAWPNDEAERGRWMATNIAFFLAEHAERQPRAELPTYHVAFELFGGLRAVADGSLSYVMEKLSSVQARWSRVADVLQMVVDIHHEKRAPIRGGGSISKALDVLRGYPSLPRKSQLSKDWSDFRDVAHLITAAAAIASNTKQKEAAAVLTPVLLAPELVLAFGLAYQEFGLSFKPHGKRLPILPPESLWRIPATENAPILPLLVRTLSDTDLKYLSTARRAQPKV
jgi:hypothetical protein